MNKRAKVRIGYEIPIYKEHRYDILINKNVLQYRAPNTADEDYESRINVPYSEVSDFLERVVYGMFWSRIYITLGFEQHRHFWGLYDAATDSHFDDIVVPPVMDKFLELLIPAFTAVLYDEYPLCIDVESCGIFSMNEVDSDIVIRIHKK